MLIFFFIQLIVTLMIVTPVICMFLCYIVVTIYIVSRRLEVEDDC